MTAYDDREFDAQGWDEEAGAPLDLSALRTHALDPARCPARWEQMVRRIEAAARPELERRREAAREAATTPPILIAFARYATPMLAAAAAIVIAATALTATSGDTAAFAPTVADEISVARALQVREPAATWLVGERAPSTTDLVVAMTDDEGGP